MRNIVDNRIFYCNLTIKRKMNQGADNGSQDSLRNSDVFEAELSEEWDEVSEEKYSQYYIATYVKKVVNIINNIDWRPWAF